MFARLLEAFLECVGTCLASIYVLKGTGRFIIVPVCTNVIVESSFSTHFTVTWIVIVIFVVLTI